MQQDQKQKALGTEQSFVGDKQSQTQPADLPQRQQQQSEFEGSSEQKQSDKQEEKQGNDDVGPREDSNFVSKYSQSGYAW